MVPVELSTESLEAELAAIAEHAEPGRTACLALRYWGWDGQGGTTLEEAGRPCGITRERVRQLCERLANRLEPQATSIPAPALERALILAAHHVPTTAKALARRLADERISARSFDPEGLLVAAEILGREATFSLDVIKDIRVVVPDPPDPGADTNAVILAIIEAARASVRRAGATRIVDVTGRVAAQLAVLLDCELVTALVTEPDDFVWLDRRGGWFTLLAVAKNSVVSRVVKVLSVSPRIGLAELHAGIRRDERMREFVMPEYVLGELCERIPNVRVVGGVVISDRPADPGDVLENNELLLVTLLREHGGALRRRDLEALCLEAGMKPSSFHNRVAYSPLLADLGRGIVGLRGMKTADLGPIAAPGSERTPRR